MRSPDQELALYVICSAKDKASGVPPNGGLPEVFFFFNLEKQKLWIKFALILTPLSPKSKFAGTMQLHGLSRLSPLCAPA